MSDGNKNQRETDATFLGLNIPFEVKAALPLLKSLSQPQTRSIMKAVVGCWSESTGIFLDQGNPSLVKEVSKETGLDEDACGTVFTAISYILRGAIKTNVKPDVLRSDLQFIQFPTVLVEDLVKVVSSSGGDLAGQMEARGPGFPSLENLRWRADVTISTSSLSRVFRPSILMEMTLTDGTIRTFEMSYEKFHELRFNVARVLKDTMDVDAYAPIQRFNREKIRQAANSKS